MSEEKSPDAPEPARQRIVRVPGSRRARLTPVEGSDPSPDAPLKDAPAKKDASARGTNDDRLLGDVPPHY